MISKLDEPRPVSASELADELLGFIDPDDLPGRDFEEVYPLFIHSVRTKLFVFRRSRPFALCRLQGSAESEAFRQGILHFLKLMICARAQELGEQNDGTDEDAADPISTRKVLWSIGGVDVRIIGPGPGVLDDVYGRTFSARDEQFLYAVLEGTTTQSLFDSLVRDVPRAIRSLLYSEWLLTSVQQHRYHEPPALPTYSTQALAEAQMFLQSGLGRYYSTPSAKNSLDRRLRNAIHLLVE